MTNCSYFLASYISHEMFFYLSVLCLFVFTLTLFRVFKKPIDYIFGTIVILAGLKNVIIRYQYGCVVDPINFFDLFYFNIPDALITGSLVFLILKLVFSKSNRV